LYTITSIETWKKKTKTQSRNSLHTKESKPKHGRRRRRNSKTKISVHNCLHTINDKLNIEEEEKL
jgi:hypothetical protein